MGDLQQCGFRRAAGNGHALLQFARGFEDRRVRPLYGCGRGSDQTRNGIPNIETGVYREPMIESRISWNNDIVEGRDEAPLSTSRVPPTNSCSLSLTPFKSA